jgi:hypothetical protein
MNYKKSSLHQSKCTQKYQGLPVLKDFSASSINELIREIIEELGSGHEIKYTFDRTNVTFKDKAEVLLNTELILLKLAYQNNNNLLAFGVSFKHRQSVWEQIPITYNYY